MEGYLREDGMIFPLRAPSNIEETGKLSDDRHEGWNQSEPWAVACDFRV